ncbi:MAG TPA: hypothetical protein VD794_16325, partial [Flavisolibacter sp.]|nr:hypothetical protein [Flavisolibacter sp.]
MKKINRRLQHLLVALLIGFVLVNSIAFMHAYKLTHFSEDATEVSVTDISFLEKVDLLFTGVDNPRPQTQQMPDTAFEAINIKSNKELNAWMIK